MGRHWQYLKYVFWHKLFVFREGRKLGLGIWQLLLHDLSKFRLDEWLPYAHYFYGGPHQTRQEWGTYARTYHWDVVEKYCKENVEARFDKAWLLHIHRSPHHWQFYLLKEDSGQLKVLPMPDCYRREMLADWIGAGLAITGKRDVATWYDKTKGARELHPETLAWAEMMIDGERGADGGRN